MQMAKMCFAIIKECSCRDFNYQTLLHQVGIVFINYLTGKGIK